MFVLIKILNCKKLVLGLLSLLVAPAPAVVGAGGPRRKQASAPTDVEDLSPIPMSEGKGPPFSGLMAAPLTAPSSGHPASCFP